MGSCRFCGRGICEDHVETLPFVLELFKTHDVTHALVVEDALYCGACTPRPDPLAPGARRASVTPSHRGRDR